MSARLSWALIHSPSAQLLGQGAVKTAGIAIVDVFDAGLLAQFGDAQPRREALVLSP